MITKKQRILLLLAAGYALALTGWTAEGTLLRPQRVCVECREVEPWENRLERQSPAETEDFLRRGALHAGIPQHRRGLRRLPRHSGRDIRRPVPQ